MEKKLSGNKLNITTRIVTVLLFSTSHSFRGWVGRQCLDRTNKCNGMSIKPLTQENELPKLKLSRLQPSTY